MQNSKNKLNKRHCPCGANNQNFVIQIPFVDIDGIENFNHTIRECTNCGLSYCSPIPSDEYLNNYYSKSNLYSFSHRLKEISIPEVNKSIKQVEYCKNYLSDPKFILDIGASTGSTLNQYKIAFPHSTIEGIEGSEQCRKDAKDLFSMNLKNGFIYDLDKYFDRNKFDLISLSHVLEHLSSPLKDIEEIINFLSDKGFLYIEVPALEKFSECSDQPYGHFSFEHLQYFSEASLENLFNRIGLTKVNSQITYNDPNTIPGYPVIQSIWKRGKVQITYSIPDTNHLEKYIQSTQKEILAIDSILEKLKGKSIAIWGVGSHTRSIFACTKIDLLNIKYFIDNSTSETGEFFNNIPIFPISHLIEHPVDYVIISSYSCQTEIHNQLKKDFPNQKSIALYPRLFNE